MGDWNADMLDSESSDCRFERSFIDELSLKLIDTGPSHHTANKYSWKDSLLTDNNDTIISHDWKLPTFSSSHCITFVTIETFCPETPADSYDYRCKAWFVLLLPENEYNMEGV